MGIYSSPLHLREGRGGELDICRVSGLVNRGAGSVAEHSTSSPIHCPCISSVWLLLSCNLYNKLVIVKKKKKKKHVTKDNRSAWPNSFQFCGRERENIRQYNIVVKNSDSGVHAVIKILRANFYMMLCARHLFKHFLKMPSLT